VDDGPRIELDLGTLPHLSNACYLMAMYLVFGAQSLSMKKVGKAGA
jgi:hypothetical protein